MRATIASRPSEGVASMVVGAASLVVVPTVVVVVETVA